MTDGFVLQTPRLILRRLTPDDFPELCEIIQDTETMYAYNGAFSDEEAKNWLEKQFDRYATFGFGLWAVISKETDEFLGQCGLTMQSVAYGSENRDVLEIGYLFNKKYWHNGYAAEAALGCQQYAFEVLDAPAVYSIIRDTNYASQNVAIRGGMHIVHTYTKHYRGCEMPHLVYRITREEYQKRTGADLKEVQKRVYQNKLDKGFNVTDISKEFCLIYGEVAEAYEAWRKKQPTVGEELADISIYLLGLSEILGIDLGAEINRKMQINKGRKYETVDGVLTKI